MATLNGGLITETNLQYYAGAQNFLDTAPTGSGKTFTTTFDTDLEFGSYDPLNANYGLNNFKLYTSATGVSYTEYILPYTVVDNVITITGSLTMGTYIIVQLKSVDGGNYGNKDAFGHAVEDNYGEYAYVSLDDVINNFLIAYVGEDKLIPSVKRTDVLFHAKRGLQEFSYDTLKSIKSQELMVTSTLSITIPQDYVNYVRASWIDRLGVKHIIYPTQLTSNPGESPLQSADGAITQSSTGANIETESVTEERWRTANTNRITGVFNDQDLNEGLYDGIYNRDGFGIYGARYGSQPETTQINGWFTVNERNGSISFSSNLVGTLVIFEYLSDGLAYDADTKIPKMAEDAMYSHLSYSILAGRINQPEYVINRLRRERSAKLRNAKIRLSNIKLGEINQVFRNKSKIIKH